MRTFDVSFVVGLNKLLSKRYSCRCITTPWRSCDLTIMYVYQAAFSRTWAVLRIILKEMSETYHYPSKTKHMEPVCILPVMYVTYCARYLNICYFRAVTSWWVRWRLKSPTSRLFAQPFVEAQIKENIKVPPDWAFARRIHWWPVDSPHQRASNAQNVSIWWRHHVTFDIAQTT